MAFFSAARTLAYTIQNMRKRKNIWVVYTGFITLALC
jgi:hypothetical protein